MGEMVAGRVVGASAATSTATALLRICAAALLFTDAVSCDAGQYYDKGLIGGSCKSCDPGKFSIGDSDKKEPKSCTSCKDGEHCAGGATSAGSCAACAAGQYSKEDHSACAACGLGQYSDKGKKACIDCDPGTYSTGGTGSCTTCGDGKHSDKGKGICDACAPGKHADADHKGCSDCKDGKHSGVGAGSCSPCGAGKHSNGALHTACIDCNEGEYSTGSAASCDNCPADSSSEKGSIAVSECHCNPGYMGTISGVSVPSGSCIACSVGQFKAGVTPGAKCRDCAPGQYQELRGQPSCTSCGDLDGCVCQGKSKSWPNGPDAGGTGGICRQGSACIGAATCVEGATCTPSGPTAHTCDCNSGDVFGLTCERNCELGPDENNPQQAWCDNLGSCVYDPSDSRGYNCKCKQGYSGPNCRKIDPCIVLSPCHNGGTCDNVTIKSRGYECMCPTGFSGVNCTTLTTAWQTQSDGRARLVVVGVLAMACYCGMYWTFLQSFDEENSRAQLVRIAVVLIVLVVMCIGFAIAAASESDATTALKLYGLTAAMTILQSLIALGFHKWIDQKFPNFATEGASRLLRGAGLALVALAAAGPGIVVGILVDPNRLDPARVDVVADIFVIYGWHPIIFSVLLPCLPIGVVLSRVYRKEQLRQRGDCSKFLSECGVPNPDLFLRAERSFASLSGLLLPFFWNSHLVNEQQELLSFASADRIAAPGQEVRYIRANKQEFASVDGVRALSPVVGSLNFMAAGWGCYMISAFPAPLVWTPSLFFGVVWCAAMALTMTVLSFILTASLSEHRNDAGQRDLELIWAWKQHCIHGEIAGKTSHSRYCCNISTVANWDIQNGRNIEEKWGVCDYCKEFYYCLKTYVTSWTGQTVISGINHLLAICFFSYGLHEFDEYLTLSLKKFLVAGLILTGVGVITSTASVIQRRWPECKVTPTDDSFRVACVLKALLVMNKALIVYELSKIDMRMLPRLQTWTMWVTAVCVISVFILALLTYAFDACKVYAIPKELENAGIPDGRKFIKMYSFSFFCCKLATIFFVVLGHIPELAGCGSEAQEFKGTREMLLNRDGSLTIECIICFPNNKLNDTRCLDDAPNTYYPCTTTCAKLFFSGGGKMPISLDVFVLVPILWLPFMVYSNNEVARMIDGVWQRRSIVASSTGKNSQSVHTSARVGLSTTGHGYSAIANLAHAVFLLCGAAHLYFLLKSWIATGHFGYVVDAPPGNMLIGDLSLDLGDVLQEPLDEAGRYVTWSVIVLNLLTLSRFLYEKLRCFVNAPRSVSEPLQMLLADTENGSQVAVAGHPDRDIVPVLCYFKCGRLPTQGHDTCCRACAIAGGHLSPMAHDRNCTGHGSE